ncbi:MAG: hypothetical protein ACTSRU_09420 [Candidatus Hodarchaeales archaeon]
MQEYNSIIRENSAGRIAEGRDDYYTPEYRDILVFNGTLLDNYRLAKLHNRITANETGYSKKRRFIELAGILNQWFDTNLLDKASILLVRSGDRLSRSHAEEITKYLAFIDTLLRLEGNTVRWKTILEISDYFNISLTRKKMFKYRLEAQRILAKYQGRLQVLKKLRKSPEIIMKKIAWEFIAADGNMSAEEKKRVRKKCFKLIESFKASGFIPRDFEIYGFAVYYLTRKECLKKPGNYSYNFPVSTPAFNRSISNAIYNIKKKVIEPSKISILTDHQPLQCCTTAS